MKLATIIATLGVATMGSALPLGNLFARNPAPLPAAAPEPAPLNMDTNQQPSSTGTPTKKLPVPTATGTGTAQVKRAEEVVYHFPRNFPDFGL